MLLFLALKNIIQCLYHRFRLSTLKDIPNMITVFLCIFREETLVLPLPF